MTSKIESGFSTYTGNYRLLINICDGFGTAYAPTIDALQTKNMNTQLNDALTAIATVDSYAVSYMIKETARQEAFAPLRPLAVRVLGTATASALSPTVLVHFKEIVRKIQGRRAKALNPDEIIDDQKHISVSQQSYNEQLEHFNQLITLVLSQPDYAPADPDLSFSALSTRYTAMQAANNALKLAFVPLADARQKRDHILYEPVNGMIDTALRAKEYVKAIFGAASPQYKEVKHISFRNRAI